MKIDKRVTADFEYFYYNVGITASAAQLLDIGDSRVTYEIL